MCIIVWTSRRALCKNTHLNIRSQASVHECCPGQCYCNTPASIKRVLVALPNMSPWTVKCRNPDPPQHSLLGRAVWAVPHAMLLRDTVEHVHAACEMALAPVNAVHRTLTEAEQNVTEIRQAVQQMLQYAEVEGAGSLWGHDTSMMHQPPPPRSDRSAVACVIHTAHERCKCYHTEQLVLVTCMCKQACTVLLDQWRHKHVCIPCLSYLQVALMYNDSSQSSEQ